MVLSPVPVVPAGQGGDEAAAAEAGGLLAQAVAGPGLWEDLLGELRRAGLITELLADGVIATAVGQAEHGHKLDRALTAEVTAMAVIAGALFPDQGYDLILARTFAMPGLPVKPGTLTPSGPALSKARVLLGEQVMRRIFEIDAARADADPGIGAARPRRRSRRPRPAPDPVHRRARPDPRQRHRRYVLPALRQTPRQRKRPHRPARQPDPRPARPPGPARPDLRHDSLPAPALAHRRGHIHHNDRPVESPESDHKSRKLRAVANDQIQ